MTYKKVLELAKKFAKDLESEKKQAIEFGYEFTNKLRAISNEMAGDLRSLKEKGFDPIQWKSFASFYHMTIELNKSFNYENEYSSAQKIVQMISQPDIMNFINSLNSSIHNFLKENKTDIGNSILLAQTKVESLQKLVGLINWAHFYMKKHPMSIVEEIKPPISQESAENKTTH